MITWIETIFYKFYIPRTNDSMTISNPINNSPQIIQKEYTLPENSSNTNNYAMYRLDVNYSKYYDFEISCIEPIDIRLYDKYMQLVNISINNYSINNLYCYSIHHFLMQNNYYYLRVECNTSTYELTIYTTITSNHLHSYHYTWLNYTRHQTYCECGTFSQKPHVINMNDYQNGNQYATCLLCHGLASVGIVNSNNTAKINSNSCIILDNGIIVINNDYSF